ncbi:MAG: NAD(P)-binding protein, partial [Bdellovibrionota bacterium]|nr:NAD(P)-binding protein [Bdellovibrionota bacterium]
MKKSRCFCVILFAFFCLNPLIYGKSKVEVLKGDMPKVFKIHSSLFDTFMPLEKVGRTEKMRLLVKKKKRILWENFIKDEQIALALRVFGDLKLFTSKTIIKLIYKIVTKEEDEIKKVDDKSINKLKTFFKSIRSKKLRPAIYHLTRQERLRFFELMIHSDINFHRYLAFSIRNAYMNSVYSGDIVNELSGIKDDTDNTANPLPKIPDFKGPLSFDRKRRKFKGELDYIIVGSGVSGSVVANQLQKAGKKVLVLEKGPFVLPGSIKTYLNWKFLLNQMPGPDNDGSVVFMNASMVGGGSSLNNGFSFPPTLPYIKSTINGWRKKWKDSGRPYYDIWSPEEMERAYSWLEDKFRPRVVEEGEINNNNLLLKEGFFAHTGMKAKKFDLFRFKKGEGPTEVYDMKSAVETFLFESLFDKKNPLTL